MKKIIALLIAGMLAMGPEIAFAQEEEEVNWDKEVKKISRAFEKLAVDFMDLLVKKIPETTEMLSATGTKKDTGSDK